jgi:hypothetical protein
VEVRDVGDDAAPSAGPILQVGLASDRAGALARTADPEGGLGADGGLEVDRGVLADDDEVDREEGVDAVLHREVPDVEVVVRWVGAKLQLGAMQLQGGLRHGRRE